MRLDARLQAVADFVPPKGNCRVADIGTDHAYLPVALVASGRASYVIASDKNAGPCDAARHTVEELGMGASIDVRRGDGFSSVHPGEVNTVCIAGMGGTLICDILAAGKNILQKVETMVFQPMNAVPALRAWLYAHGWYLSDEALAEADGRLYEILQAKKGRMTMPCNALLTIGPVLWQKKPPLLKRHIEQIYQRYHRVMKGMESSGNARNSTKYKEVTAKIEELEAYRSW